ncbi:TlpA disulfide reductase family protein [Methylococcus capsulatus]|uniref:TlpA disulfide reductase family protein n=1 Tax=Methylococcus capsulatus TaxID=414 RepID=UPI002FD9DC36
MSDRFLLIVVAVSALLAGALAQRWLSVAATDWQGPESVFPDMSGRPVRLSDEHSEVLLLNFWASWCEPCREEMPVLDELQAEFGPRGLKVVGLALEDRAAVAAFLRRLPVGYRILVGERGGDALAARLGDAGGGLPFTVAFDIRGQVLATFLGSQTRDGFLAVIGPRLLSPR